MQGELYYYRGLVGGFKKLHAIIEGADFVLYYKPPEKRTAKDEYLRIALEKGSKDMRKSPMQST